MSSPRASRNNPLLILILQDGSASTTDEAIVNGQCTRIDKAIQNAVNANIADTIELCTNRRQEIQDAVHFACLGYAAGSVTSLLPDTSVESPVLRASQLAHLHLGVDMIDGQSVPRYIVCSGKGNTPQKLAYRRAAETIERWLESHPNASRVIVLDIGDGESTDGDPCPEAESIRRIRTIGGDAILFAVNLCAGEHQGVIFPASESELDSDAAVRLFRMASSLPDEMIQFARAAGLEAPERAKALTVNAPVSATRALLAVGSHSMLRPPAPSGEEDR